jgi:hypothetical protein
VRSIASPISGPIGRMRIFGVARSSFVGWIESVMTSSFSRDLAMR